MFPGALAVRFGFSSCLKAIAFVLLISLALLAGSGSGAAAEASAPPDSLLHSSVKYYSGAAANSPVEEADECRPGTGWVWTDCPDLPDVAARSQQALEKAGIAANVKATAFGETDSCGTFALSGTDYAVTLTDHKQGRTTEERQQLGGQVASILKEFAERRMGNLRLLFASGDTLAVPAREVSSPLRSPSSSPTFDDTALTKKVFVLVYDPLLSNGQLLHEYYGWNSYSPLTEGLVTEFASSSHGILNYQIVDTPVVLDEWNLLTDGFRYDETSYLDAMAGRVPWHRGPMVDYNYILKDPRFDICGRVNRGEIDELWLWGGPGFGYWESTLAGPGAYWYNSQPVPARNACNRLLPIMGFNYERGQGEATEDFGHRTESTMAKVYGSWAENRTLYNFDRFALVKRQSPNYSYSGCGNIHYPPNGVRDYDYLNTSEVLSNCDDFYNYPALGDPLAVAQPVSCTAWNCQYLDYFMYWYDRFPANPGCAPDGILSDWWNYFADPGRALAPYCGIPVLDLHPSGAYGQVDPVVPSSQQGTSTTNTLYAGAYTFFDIRFINNGMGTAVGPFAVDLWIDDVGFGRTFFQNVPNGVPYGTNDWPILVNSPGVHTVRFVVDADNTVPETDENNNNWEQQFTWVPITGWKGEYYRNTTLKDPPWLIRDYAAVNFEGSAEWPDPSIPHVQFSAAWTRSVTFTPGIHRFHLLHDDGARLYIDGAVVLDNWCSDCRKEDDIDVPLTEGSHSLRVEMWENFGSPAIKLTWEQLPDCFTLSTASSLEAGGSVNAAPAPNCNNGTQYTDGTVVTLTANANSGYAFSGWSGDASGLVSPTTVTMTGAKSATANFTLIQKLEEASMSVQYNGWRGITDANASGGTYRMSNATNDKLTYKFSGTSETWVTRTGPDQGKAQVLLDGVGKGTFDLYSPTYQWQVNKSLTGLVNKAHTLVIKVLGTKNASSTGTNVAVDALQVGTKTYEENDCTVTYNTWACLANSNLSGGSVRYSGSASAGASLSFMGISIDWITAMCPQCGKVNVIIDGTTVETGLDLYAATNTFNVVKSYPVTGPGPHTIKIVPTGTRRLASKGNFVPVDAFEGPITPIGATVQVEPQAKDQTIEEWQP